ncbi:bifunctional 2',3'-cyclic-nucleotide 2'-phosphodiesterase/3'-nucleotidase [Caballeronia sp. LZ034LL]|uniref:bifunctional 2',3'-cyclic-nucleotide 2'-phosphodiesterase/3'-nucleotidase n=1 Tax=Caballeronia sp. LZ034LL TaxID=3038567 RepID=UPI002855E7DD|nr:bifunctional 2',3'-cyclic-nucleotide 2'-phosphodiesterase/3'-nucleotidase [Caballeronia sp. LZ034LL]MDR5836087.1 bifunctional 2',3'-cyclic-nucleotide 2'-phosphodiesterase/3'-nucleotidase [Caballeronia sp. LZ034LL]
MTTERNALLALAVTSTALLAACGSNDDNSPPATPAVADGTKATLAMLETTDIHTNVLSYDYFKLAEDKSIGLERTATLIAAARKEFPNTMLLDDGDTIQGTALSDYQALVSPIDCKTTLAVYKVMNALNYDAGTIGNHEFNYGLPFLAQVTGSKLDVPNLPPVAQQQACSGPAFPLVLSNVFGAKSAQPIFKPYTIVTRNLQATGPDGKTVTVPVKVGVIGFTPPAIMSWDKRNLDGNVYTQGLKESAEKYVPQMRAEGAQVVVALSHGGLDNSPYSPSMENGSYYLSTVPGIDVLMIGHSHQVFPDASSTVAQFNLPGVDKVKGTVNGIPTVMANFWGKHLGVIALSLTYSKGAWAIDKNATKVEARPIQNADKTYVAADPSVSAAIAAEHLATINYVKTPIGSTDFRMTTYFADVGDVSAVEIVNQAQAQYVSDYVAANLPEYAGIPVLSVSAPFKSGFGGGTDFTDVSAGNVAINNAADLYLYPNTVYAVKVTGADLKAWLETAAQRFNRIDPAQTAAQELVSSYPGYNFDMITSKDFSYEIDVTQAVGSRIRNLSYKGTPVASDQAFIVATNNYRASGGGNFPGLDGSKTIYASPDANRDVLISYIKKVKAMTSATNGIDRSWRFTKVSTQGPVTFKSAPNLAALAQTQGIANVTQTQADDGTGKGLAVYSINLAQ